MTLTAPQLEERRSRLGASDVPIVAGLYPGKNALDVYAQKVLGVNSADTRFSKWGTKLEAVVALAYAERMGVKVQRHGRVSMHPVERWIGATPDYRVLKPLMTKRKLLEIKTGDIHTANHWGEDGTDQVPDRVLAQVAIQMACEDADLADVAVLLGGNDLRVYHLVRDRDAETALIEFSRPFWFEHVVPKIPPALDHTESSKRLLASLFPNHDDLLLDAPQSVVTMVEQMKELESGIKPMEQEVDRLENEVRAAIGEHVGFRLPDGSKITWKQQNANPKWKDVALKLGATTADADASRGEPFRRIHASWRRGS